MEYLFNVPGYLAFSLIPIIQMRYKHMHPLYLNNLKQFKSVQKMREELKINGDFQLDSMNNCSVTMAMIRQFYFDFIQNRTSI